MRVPGIVFASEVLFPAEPGSPALQQVANVATLPGIVTASFAMPDVHWGYGFPIGGVAATEVAAGGVVSPGGVGFDISCGVRLLATALSENELAPHRRAVLDALGAAIPRGVGRGGVWRLPGRGVLEGLLTEGARYAVREGHGVARDLERCEDGGAVSAADPGQVSPRAIERGGAQVGSLGSGNHFLEVQVIDRILDDAAAAAFGLVPGTVCVMIHCGSRGLGHQICTDHVQRMAGAMRRYGIEVPDRQLACVPVDSPEGRSYLGAMAAAANFGRANRQLLTEAARTAFARVLGPIELDLVYDVSHNLAKLETHPIGGVPTLLCVHRKGATRALPPGDAQLPGIFAAHGQPVLVPGSMGTSSWVLAGQPGNPAFNSACHGAGRVLSRHAAARQIRGDQLRSELETAGIAVRAASVRGLAEEAPVAYKDADAVVEVCELSGLARRVARLRPVGVVKG